MHTVYTGVGKGNLVIRHFSMYFLSLPERGNENKYFPMWVRNPIAAFTLPVVWLHMKMVKSFVGKKLYQIGYIWKKKQSLI